MTSFDDLGLSEPLLRALGDAGYQTPTPIQASAIPALKEGRDLVGIAQTGTGKTAAFLLPLMERLWASRAQAPARYCRALIIAPTRELAGQIEEAIRVYGRHMRLSSAVVIGGASYARQSRAMQRGLDILVATPGRLLDHLANDALRLDRTTAVVLDEADQMLDLGFLPAIRRIVRALPVERQTLLFSATMPKQIRALADDFMRDPLEVAVTPAARPAAKVEQRVIAVPKTEKRRVLVELLSEADVGRAIVFTRTKRGADRVCRHLEGAGLSAVAIHGDKSQGQRERALSAFKAGRVPTLVATDIAARGIDVDDISHVVNFELPNVPEVYVHRIGRTARAGASGQAITLMDSEERELLSAIERLTGATLLDDGKSGQRPARKARNRKKPTNRSNRPERRESGDHGLARLLEDRPKRTRRRRRASVRPAA